jgi:hypothetical protein
VLHVSGPTGIESLDRSVSPCRTDWPITGRMTNKPMKSVAKISDEIDGENRKSVERR